MPTSQYGPSKDWNNITLASKPFLVVSPGGPDDGGDYGPGTPGTTTGGIQEAINTGLYVRVMPGTYNITASTITISEPSQSNVIYLSCGVVFTGNGFNITYSNINSNFAIISDMPVGNENYPPPSGAMPIIASLSINTTTTSMSAVYVQGCLLGGTTTVTNAGSNLGLGELEFVGCYMNAPVTIVQNGSPQYPTWIYFLNCVLYCNGSTVNGAGVGQISIVSCQAFFSANNSYLVSLNGECTQVHVYDLDLVTEAFTGCGLILCQSSLGAYIVSCVVNGAYIEDLAPCVLLTATASLWAGSYEFSNINYSGSGTNELLLAVGGANLGTYLQFSSITLRDIGFTNAGIYASENYTLGLGTAPVPSSTLRLCASNVQGVTGQGYAMTTPAFPATTVNQANTHMFPVEILILTVGGGISVYTITDVLGNAQAVTMTVAIGQKFILQPGDEIKFTIASGTPTWKWKGLGS